MTKIVFSKRLSGRDLPSLFPSEQKDNNNKKNHAGKSINPYRGFFKFEWPVSYRNCFPPADIGECVIPDQFCLLNFVSIVRYNLTREIVDVLNAKVRANISEACYCCGNKL